MKKIVCSIIIFILCCGVFGCSKEINNNKIINDNIIEEKTNKIILYVMPYYDLTYQALNVYLYDYYNEKYTYDLFCDNGYVTHSETKKMYKRLDDVRNVFSFSWNPVNEELETKEQFEEAYLTIVQKEYENIVGFAIIKLIQSDADENTYYSDLIKSVCFPKINNSYQSISDNYIEEEVAKYHDIKD